MRGRVTDSNLAWPTFSLFLERQQTPRHWDIASRITEETRTFQPNMPSPAGRSSETDCEPLRFSPDQSLEPRSAGSNSADGKGESSVQCIWHCGEISD